MTSGRSNVVQPAARSSERCDEDVDEEWRRTPLEQRLDRFKAELEDALSADRSLRQHENEPAAGGADGAGHHGEARICASVLHSYVHCVHEAMQNKEGRFRWSLSPRTMSHFRLKSINATRRRMRGCVLCVMITCSTYSAKTNASSGC